MIRPLRLNAGNQWLTTQDLMKGIPSVSLSDQENRVVQLCRDWLTGKQEFEFQTSGSTGTSKKIRFKRNQLESSARLTEQALQLRPGYTALVCLDVRFIAGAMMVIRSLVTGMDMIIRDPAANPLAEISETIDFAALVPYQLQTVLEQTPSALLHVRKVIIGGANLPANSIERLQSFPVDFYATYGMTETITHVALQKLNGSYRQDYFQLLPGIRASTDDRGCLILHVPHVRSEPIVTNDVVALLEETKFRWVGRFDRVINSGGVKVQPEKIEKAAESIFTQLGVEKRFFIVGIPDPKLGEKVALILEGPKIVREKEQQILAMLSQCVALYEVPKILLFIDHFIETNTQKIDRLATMKVLTSAH